jgi:hypothetical protein
MLSKKKGAPSFCQKASGPSRIVYLVLLIAYRKIDMAQHCKWIAYGADGLGGKGCTRMRPKLHLPVFGYASRITGVMA